MEIIEIMVAARFQFSQLDNALNDALALPEPMRVGESGTADIDITDVVCRLNAGDSEALGELYDRYAPSLYRVLCALLNSTTDAEDALQEVFLRIVTKPGHRIHDLRSYLFIVARNEAYNILRRRRRERPEEIPDAADQSTLQQPDSSPTYDWAKLLARLPLDQREAIVLKVWEQMTFGEIAHIVKASPNTVASRYRYGIERLRSWCREEDSREN